MPSVIALLVSLAFIAIFGGVYFTLSAEHPVDGHLALERGFHNEGGSTTEQRLRQHVNEKLERGEFGAGLSLALYQAGIRLTAAEFLAINFGLIIVTFLLGWLFSQNIFGGAGLGLVAAIIPRFWLKQQKSRRLTAFQNQLPDVLNLLVGSLRSGYGMLQSLKMVAQEMPKPSQEEYERVTQEIALGIPITSAMDRLVHRMESPDLEMVSAAMQIQSETGGNLGDILEVIAETIRERVRIQGEIRSITGMQRATSYLLAALPVILAVVLLLMNPKYMMAIFVFPWIMILIFAGINVLIGLFLISKMVKSIDF